MYPDDPPSNFPAGDPGFFRCHMHQTGLNAVWLNLAGELDLASRWYLGVRLEDALAAAHLVVVDLRELTFMDSSGLGVIVAADVRAKAGRRRLLIIRGPRQVERLLEVTGLLHRLDMSPPQVIRGPLAVTSGPASRS